MKQTCEYCHGVIKAPPRCSIERTVAIHLDSCPAALRLKKPPKAVVPPEPRKRMIPRQVL